MAANDPQRMIQQTQEARRQKVGALVAAPINPVSLAPSLKELIWDGAYVGSIVPPPAISLLNAPQFLTGKVLGDAAATYIRTRLGGRARVVLLTHDTNQFLAQRFVAIRQALKHMPEVKIEHVGRQLFASHHLSDQLRPSAIVAHCLCRLIRETRCRQTRNR